MFGPLLAVALAVGWGTLDRSEIPAAEQEGLVFALRREEDGASYTVKATSRQAREGEGKRYANLLKRRGGIALDERVVIGGMEGWRIVRLSKESDQPLVRSTVFLPHQGRLYQLTGNLLGVDDPEAVRSFADVEGAITLVRAAAPDTTPTQPIDLPGGVHASLPLGWKALTEAQISQLLPESFGEVEAAFFSPDEDHLFYVAHVGAESILETSEHLKEIGDQFQSQLSEMIGARMIGRQDEEVAGRPAHRLVYGIDSPDGNNVYESRLLTLRNGQLLYLGGLALQARQSEALAVFDGIFATVAIDAPARSPEQVARAEEAKKPPPPTGPIGKGLFPPARD
jgi:hypothetical protein